MNDIELIRRALMSWLEQHCWNHQHGNDRFADEHTRAIKALDVLSRVESPDLQMNFTDLEAPVEVIR